MNNTQLKIRVMAQLFDLIIRNEDKRMQPDEIEKKAVEIINLNQAYLLPDKEPVNETE